MQTALDRWLRSKFAIETHIFTVSDPGDIPGGLKRRDLGKSVTSQYQYQFTTCSERTAQKFIDQLRGQQQTFTTEIVARKTFLAKLVTPRGKSFTYASIGFLFTFSMIAAASIWLLDAIISKRFQEEIDGVWNFLTQKYQ